MKPYTRFASSASAHESGQVLGARIHALSMDQAVTRITDWAARRESRYVCLCNVHSVVTASREPDFQDSIHGADLAAPDGAPVAWMLRRQGFAGQPRLAGPDLMWACLARAQALELSIFLYGSTEATLALLRARLQRDFPGLRVAGTLAPPFRHLTLDEERQMIARIKDSGAQVVFVGLGCPKQELWMARQRPRIPAVLVGVGAAFDYHAGTLRRAPLWWQSHGLEWAYRLAMEPRRLARRYAVTNTLFLIGCCRQFLAQGLRGR